MANLVVSFDSLRDARDAVRRLNNAHIGVVRTRILDGDEGSTWMIDPGLGAIQVRPTDDPNMAAGEAAEQNTSASIPATGSDPKQVRLFIEIEDADEAKARKILGLWGGSFGEQSEQEGESDVDTSADSDSV